jgi:hypothetical protein
VLHCKPLHQRCCMILGRKAAGVQHHQALGDGVDAQGEDHRRDPQIGNAETVDDADDQSAEHGEWQRHGRARVAPPTGCGGRHHATDRYHPRNRKIDMAQKNDQHGAAGDDAQKRRRLQLQQQITDGEEPVVERNSHHPQKKNEAEYDKDRQIDVLDESLHGLGEEFESVSDAEHTRGAHAYGEQ